MTGDLLALAVGALASHRLRSVLSLLGIAIGIASVILLTSIGEGTRRYVVGQFSQFGTNVLQINPGKTETFGIPGVLGGTTHFLTIDDAQALTRIAGVERVVPAVFGTARVESGERGRNVFVFGVTPDIPAVWQFRVRQGTFWPAGDPRRGAPLAVLGTRLAHELFGDASPLGSFVRIGGTRFRVSGVMEPKGQMLGFDIDDAVYVPVASALRLFNQPELNEIDLLYANAEVGPQVEAEVRRVLTLVTQAAMLDVFGRVMNVVTLAVGGIAGISLLVGAIGILTMMWIAVGERVGEIGLVRALGASRRQVRLLFLAEAAGLSTLGGLLGVVAGLGLAALLRALVPGLPVETPVGFVLAALATSLATGLASGVLPAQRAAELDPTEALRAE
jgi:putative ABC transport system permease protein